LIEKLRKLHIYTPRRNDRCSPRPRTFSNGLQAPIKTYRPLKSSHCSVVFPHFLGTSCSWATLRTRWGPIQHEPRISRGRGTYTHRSHRGGEKVSATAWTPGDRGIRVSEPRVFPRMKTLQEIYLKRTGEPGLFSTPNRG
jgi:hypothetical protein